MFEKIVKLIDAKTNLLITGPAGTGKSTLVKRLKEHYGKRFIITSTTGVSALNIGGSTIHSFSGIGIHTEPRAIHTITNQFNWRKVSSRIRWAKILVIDEVSMLRLDQLELMDLVFREATGIDAPFGGKRIVFVGDFLQLPPVAKFNEPHNKEWIFNSQLWNDAQIKVIELTTIYRQDDEVFLNHLMRLRFGMCEADTDDFFKSRTFKANELDSNMLRFFSTNAEADQYNDHNLELIEDEEHIHYAEVDGENENYIKQIKSSTLALERLELKVGARVMFLTNQKSTKSDDGDVVSNDFAWVNGSLGTVVDYKAGWPLVEVDETGERVIVEEFTWKMTNYMDEVLASFRQIPLKLAYGVTIHKSQGLTLTKAVIDCKKIFASGQGYVAISRVRTAEGLYLLNWNKSFIKANQGAIDFYVKHAELESKI